MFPEAQWSGITMFLLPNPDLRLGCILGFEIVNMTSIETCAVSSNNIEKRDIGPRELASLRFAFQGDRI